MKKIVGVILSVMLILTWIGCSKKVTKTAPATQEAPKPVETPRVESKQPEPVDTGSKETSLPKPVLSFQEVNFDFDKFDLRADAREILANHARSLKENPEVMLKIEGHCDERGTVEYNLALGERRANAVKNYLVTYGIEPTRLQTISYGKERPLDMRSNEEAWAKNRRAAFVIRH